MRASLAALTRVAVAEQSAVGAFTCYDLATADAVIAGAERVGLPVVLLVPPVVAGRERGLRFIASLRLLADAAAVPVVVQLDHAPTAELINAAVAAGADAVLADASAAGYEQNVAFVAGIRAELPEQIDVEAELGALAGDEDRSGTAVSAAPDSFTHPEEARAFVQATGVQLLAVAIGNVHGSYRGTPQIEAVRLSEIAAQVPVPLVLHGASGIPPQQLARAVTRGVGKVNINTELRGHLLDTLEHELPLARRAGDDLATLSHGVAEAVTARVAELLTFLSSPELQATPTESTH